MEICRPLPISQGAPRMAACILRHRQVWALKSQPAKPRLNGRNPSGPVSGYAVVSRPLTVPCAHSTVRVRQAGTWPSGDGHGFRASPATPVAATGDENMNCGFRMADFCRAGASRDFSPSGKPGNPDLAARGSRAIPCRGRRAAAGVRRGWRRSRSIASALPRPAPRR